MWRREKLLAEQNRMLRIVSNLLGQSITMGLDGVCLLFSKANYEES